VIGSEVDDIHEGAIGLFGIDSNMPELHGIESNTANERDMIFDHEGFERRETLSDSIKPDILVEMFGDDEDLMMELDKEVVFLVGDRNKFKILFGVVAVLFRFGLLTVAGII
jgi:hypothetical protein